MLIATGEQRAVHLLFARALKFFALNPKRAVKAALF